MIHLLIRLMARLPAGLRRSLVGGLINLVWRLYTREVVTGKENLPDGPCLFICNHLSNADATTLLRALRPRTVYFLAGVKLSGTVLTRIVMETVPTIPIRPNSADVEAIKRTVETLHAGKSALIFPEGGRSRSGQLLRAKKGVALIARRAGVPIVPVALTGTEKFLPINDQDMGGEKPQKSVTLTVRVGRPFRVEDLTLDPETEDERQAIADAMMLRVSELLPPEYRGAYPLEQGNPAT